MKQIAPLSEPIDAGLDRIERRISGRRMAGELLELLAPEDRADRFFMESLIDSIKAHAPPPAEPAAEPLVPPIGYLGATRMPFGQYMGMALDDVPIEYLDWLCRNQEDFYRDLKAYLKHPELESRRRGIES